MMIKISVTVKKRNHSFLTNATTFPKSDFILILISLDDANCYP